MGTPQTTNMEVENDGSQRNSPGKKTLGGTKINYDLHPPHGFRLAFVSKMKRPGGGKQKTPTPWRDIYTLENEAVDIKGMLPSTIVFQASFFRGKSRC